MHTWMPSCCHGSAKPSCGASIRYGHQDHRRNAATDIESRMGPITTRRHPADCRNDRERYGIPHRPAAGRGVLIRMPVPSFRAAGLYLNSDGGPVPPAARFGSVPPRRALSTKPARRGHKDPFLHHIGAGARIPAPASSYGARRHGDHRNYTPVSCLPRSVVGSRAHLASP